jgi:hypothetical protein
VFERDRGTRPPDCSLNDGNGAGRAVLAAKAEWLIWVGLSRWLGIEGGR